MIRFINAFSAMIQNASMIRQFIFLSLSFISAFLLTKSLEGKILKYIEDNVKHGKVVHFRENIISIIQIIFLPIMSIVCMMLWYNVIPYMKTDFIISTIKILAVLMISRIVSYVRDGGRAYFFIIIVVGVEFCKSSGLDDFIENYMHNIRLHIVDVHISLYILLKSFVALIILYWIASSITRIGSRVVVPMICRNDTYVDVSLYMKLLNYLVYSIGAIVTLNIIGVSSTNIALVGSAIGLGIGIGLQKITANFISGIILMAEKSIKTGDIVQDGDKIIGIVQNMGVRATIIQTPDGRDVIIPNEDFVIKAVTNLTYSSKKARGTITVFIKNLIGISQAIDIMIDVTKKCTQTSNKFLPRCVADEMIPGIGMRITLNFWIEDVIATDLGVAKSAVLIACIEALSDAGIEVTTRIDAVVNEMPKI